MPSISIRENIIKNYLSSINFKSDEWNINDIRENLKNLLGEIPSINITYKKDVVVNEITSESKEIEEIEKITIVFTDDDNKIKKIELYV